MGRIPRTAQASEETSYFAAPTYHSLEDELHALKQKNKLQAHHEPSSFWRAVTKFLPTALLDMFRQRTPTPPTKEPLRCIARLVNKNHQPPSSKAFSWPSLGTLLTYIIYVGVALLLLLIGEMKLLHHQCLVNEGILAIWYAADREQEASKQLDAVLDQLKPPYTQEPLLTNMIEAKRKYNEARDKRQEIVAALKVQGIYGEPRIVSEEEYGAWRATVSPEVVAYSRDLMGSNFPCTPSRTAELNDHQTKKA